MKSMLFSTSMVQAIMEGSKTQTRRVVKTQPDDDCYYELRYRKSLSDGLVIDYNQGDQNPVIKCPYPVGTILWVRETWNQLMSDKSYMYYASTNQPDAYKWKPSIFMPREAARIFLEVTDVRVERLQDISEEDAIAEGIERVADYGTTGYKLYTDPDAAYSDIDAVWSFESLWQSINGKTHPWDSNPWVWCYTFKQIEEPINFPS